MKKIIIGSLISFAIISCSKNETGEKSEGDLLKNDSVSPVENSSKVQNEGEVLIQNADCVSCHNKGEKMVGPSYKDIAAKYPASDENIDKLADKIIAGGKGNWGEIPMPSHVGLNKEDAKEMVKYILKQK